MSDAPGRGSIETTETPLQQVAKEMASEGWKIDTMTDSQFIASKRKPVGGLAIIGGLIGLFFLVIPGLLILLLAYVARGTESKIVTSTEAEVMLAADREKAEVMLAADREKAERAAIRTKRDIADKAEMKANRIAKYGTLGRITKEQWVLAIVVLGIAAIIVFAIATQ